MRTSRFNRPAGPGAAGVALVAVAALLLLLATPAAADEVLHFTNGTTMPVKAHTVVGEMIHVELDMSSYLAFPLAQIEKVTRRGEVVDLVRSLGERNRMAAAHAITADKVDAGSTHEDRDVKTMEEKVREYSRAARGEGPTAAPVQARAGMSNSAAGIRSIELGSGQRGGSGIRGASVGASPNLSGRRIGVIRSNQRKTVGGVITLQRDLPNSAGVELVGKQRIEKTGGSSESGGGGSSN